MNKSINFSSDHLQKDIDMLLVSSDPVVMKSISSVSEVIDKVETRWPWYSGGDNEKEKLVDMDLNPVWFWCPAS
jgi:hypothetical protein